MWVHLNIRANIDSRIQWHCTICILDRNIHCLRYNTHFQGTQMNIIMHRVHCRKLMLHFGIWDSCYRRVQSSFDNWRSTARKSCIVDMECSLKDKFKYNRFGIRSSFLCMRNIFLSQQVQVSKGRTFGFDSLKSELGKYMYWIELMTVRFQCIICGKV